MPIIKADIQVCHNPQMVKKRALAVTEEVEIASQAVRPSLENDSEEEFPSSPPLDEENVTGYEAFGTLQALHGSGLHPQEANNVVAPYLRPAVYSYRASSGIDHDQRRQYGSASSLEAVHGIALFGDGAQGDDWPDDWLEPEGNAEKPNNVASAASPPHATAGPGDEENGKIRDDVRLPGEPPGNIAADELVAASTPLTEIHNGSTRSSPRSSIHPAVSTNASTIDGDDGIVTQSSSGDTLPSVQKGLPAFRAAATRYADDSIGHAGPSRLHTAPNAAHQQAQRGTAAEYTVLRSGNRNGIESPSFETPCPRRPMPNSRIRTGPIALLNAHRGITTSDVLEGHDGGHAVPDAMSTDPEKRQRQQEAFKAVKPITGRGPFSYYTNSEQLYKFCAAPAENADLSCITLAREETQTQCGSRSGDRVQDALQSPSHPCSSERPCWDDFGTSPSIAHPRGVADEAEGRPKGSHRSYQDSFKEDFGRRTRSESTVGKLG